jgi:hypothetical protein
MKTTKLTKQDVWGSFDETTHEKLSDGMIVARYKDICPIWKDELPNKSVTVICTETQFNEVSSWLEYVHGAESVTKAKTLPEGKIALRSDYKCW